MLLFIKLRLSVISNQAVRLLLWWYGLDANILGEQVHQNELPISYKDPFPKIATLQDWCGIYWIWHCPWQCWGSQEEVWRKALEFWGLEAKESEIYRLCLGFKTLQVHDIVADPIGKYDMILSRHTLQVIVFFGWCVLFSVAFVDHDPPTAFENWRCGASHCKLCKKRINFPSNYKLPNSKGKTTMCVWYKPNISERANNSGQICSFSSHLISVDCLSLQKNTDLSEDTKYRYRPVNLLLEPYFLPRPVRSWWWWAMMT